VAAPRRKYGSCAATMTSSPSPTRCRGDNRRVGVHEHRGDRLDGSQRDRYRAGTRHAAGEASGSRAARRHTRRTRRHRRWRHPGKPPSAIAAIGQRPTQSMSPAPPQRTSRTPSRCCVISGGS
jgi:hypothetical protein